MRTAEVKLLMREVLANLPKPYSEDVIDDVFGAVERNRGWKQRYEAQCDSLGRSVVNAWGGYWVANAVGKAGERQVPSKQSSLIGSYSVLDTDAIQVTRKPKDGEARELMADYYRVHQAELPAEIRKHRELIVELLMEGMPVEKAFQMVLKAAT
ncbi:hypothetical protein WG902_16615 [Ramlibacter sp. PS3R-8]|uniref:hypothetical protein n=1 Tax=Ramlibacter sp. PS3R-8 TaxID=3133437 RepID=UPI0030A0D98F